MLKTKKVYELIWVNIFNGYDKIRFETYLIYFFLK